MILIIVWFVILFGLVFLVRFTISTGRFYPKNDKTKCPNCYYATPIKEKGINKCENCEFTYLVDENGVADKSSLKENFMTFVLSVIILTYTIVVIKDFALKVDSIKNLTFDDLIPVGFMLGFTIVSIKALIRGVRNYRFYQSQTPGIGHQTTTNTSNPSADKP